MISWVKLMFLLVICRWVICIFICVCVCARDMCVARLDCFEYSAVCYLEFCAACVTSAKVRQRGCLCEKVWATQTAFLLWSRTLLDRNRQCCLECKQKWLSWGRATLRANGKTTLVKFTHLLWSAGTTAFNSHMQDECALLGSFYSLCLMWVDTTWN